MNNNDPSCAAVVAACPTENHSEEHIAYLRSLPLANALFWFIEECDALDSTVRSELFFELRARVRNTTHLASANQRRRVTRFKRNPKTKTSIALRIEKIDTSIAQLRTARDLLRDAGAGNAADYVGRALKSAEGAQRHARSIKRQHDHDARWPRRTPAAVA